MKHFLNDPRNSLSRESTLRYRFCFDMKLAVAKRGYDLKVMYGDVDNEGADIVLDDGDVLRRIQLKSIFETKTSFWLKRCPLVCKIDFKTKAGRKFYGVINRLNQKEMLKVARGAVNLIGEVKIDNGTEVFRIEKVTTNSLLPTDF